MADCDEYTVQFEIGFSAFIFRALNTQAGYTAIVTQDFIHNMIPMDLDLALFLFLKELVLQNFLGTQFVASMHQVNLGCDITQVKSLFHSCIAAADDRNRHLAKEKTVAGCTRGHAAAFECFFGIQAEVHGRGARGNDQGIAGVVAVVACKLKRTN